MRPAEAARIFEQMELPILIEIVERMREAKAAPILAQLNPLRARQIAGELARRRPPGTPEAPAAAAPAGTPPTPPPAGG
jgi:flagellar motility protein MotE (MotC chaperone)